MAEKLRNDSLDFKVKRMGSTLDWAVALTAFDLAHFAVIPILGMDEFGVNTATFLSTLVFLKPMLSIVGEGIQKAVVGDPVFFDDKLGYSSQGLYYKGAESLKLGGKDYLRHGYYLLYLKSPTLSENATVSEWMDTTELAINQLKGQLKEKNYRFLIALDVSENAPTALRAIFAHYPYFSFDTLFKGKNLEIQDKNEGIRILTPDEFDKVILSPQELFLRGCNELGDKILLEYLKLAKNSGSKDERDRVKKLIEDRLQQILQAQAQRYFNEPEAVFHRNGIKGHTKKEKVGKTSLVRKNPQQGFSVVGIFENGQVEQSSLDRLLKTDPYDMNAALEDQTLLRQAKIAYSVYQILQDIPFEELLRERMLDKEQLLTHLGERGIRVESAEINLDPLVNSRITWRRQMRVFPRRLLPIMFTLLAYAGAQLGSAVKNDEQLIRSLAYQASSVPKMITGGSGKSAASGGNSSPIHELESIGFPQIKEGGGTPAWKITAHGNISPAGYWTENTSFNLYDGNSWDVVRDKGSTVTLPKKSDDNLPHLTLERIVGLDAPVAVKIPIKPEVALAALDVTSAYGNSLSFEIQELVDGTNRLVINRSGPLDGNWAKIRAELYPNYTSVRAHSIADIKKLDIHLVHPRLLREIRDIYYASYEYRRPDDGTNFIQNMARVIRDQYTYSNTPPRSDIERLGQSKTFEQIVNTIDDMDVCNCSVCNTLNVLLYTTVPYFSPRLNMAFGYLHNLNNPGSGKGSFLLNEARHAYGIDEKGNIYDATPYSLNLDEDVTDLPIVVDEWDKKEGLLAKETIKREDIINSLKLLGGILALIPAYGVARLIFRGVNALTSEENIRRSKDRMLLSIFGREDLERAYNFLGWMSWGNVGAEEKIPEVSGLMSDKQRLIDRVRLNLRESRVNSYNQYPSIWPEPISFWERIKLRMMAKFFL